MIVKNDIYKLRNDVEELVGQPIVIKCNKGKRKTTVSKGVLMNVYSSVFIVNFIDETETGLSHNTSYSYTDLLTKRIEFLAEGKEAENFVLEEVEEF